jgi:hypothetical protein
MGADAGFSVPRQRTRFPTQMIILLLIVGVSVGALYGMRRYGMRSGVIFDTVEVKAPEDKSQEAQTYERIMADLASVQRPLDVALVDFGKSPFMREDKGQVRPNVPTDVPAQTDAERHRQEAVSALKAMHLVGIIGNVARIDDLTVRAGDKVGDLFTVKSIDGRAVTFEAYGEEFRLEMDIKKGGPGKSAATRMRPADKH